MSRYASALYEGSVSHSRSVDCTHSFRYSTYLAYIDLDELPALLGGRLLHKRTAVRFHRPDYLGDPKLPLSDCIRSLIKEKTDVSLSGPIRLLTNLRTFGHCFNPVSFYYCFSEDSMALEAVVAEVTNTPWGERHAYVLRSGSDCSDSYLNACSKKALHVSPFLSMDYDYRWCFSFPGERISVGVQNLHGGERHFEAHLSLKRRALSRDALISLSKKYPAVTLRVLSAIYIQALRLRFKGAHFYKHPDKETVVRSQARS